MSDTYYVTVGTATPTVSQAFTLNRSDWKMVVEVPSLTAGGELRPQFSITSGGPFQNLTRLDGTGLPFVVHSGAGPALGVITPPTPWGRFVSTSSVTLISTITLFEVR